MNIKDKNLVDLHVHTAYSDGMLLPEEVVRKAAEIGLKAIAITDHDCVEGIEPCIESAKGIEIEVIPGLEISAIKDETEIHILGYFVDPQNTPLLKILTELKEDRILRMKKMISCLRGQGIDISEEKVFRNKSRGAIGRLNLARAIARENKALDVKEIFDKYIGDGKPCHVKHKNLDYREAIKVIKDAGGVAVLAHPGTMGRDEDIPYYVQAGLKGIEVFHVKHRSEVSSKYLEIAKEYNLIITGGSDCHGGPKDRILIGKVKVDYEVVQQLRKEARKYG